jgi:hypothetical protein
MKKALLLSTICALTNASVLAQPDAFELKKAKSEKILVTKSAGHIDFTPQKTYDKYIISVSGENGFSKTFESDIPSLDIASLNLPEDGTYNYQIKAVQFLKQKESHLNNGRSEENIGYVSKVDVTNGKFTSRNFSLETHEQTSEKKPTFQLGLKK